MSVFFEQPRTIRGYHHEQVEYVACLPQKKVEKCGLTPEVDDYAFYFFRVNKETYFSFE